MSPNPAFAAADALRDDPRKGLVQVILDLAASAEDDGLRVGDMVDRLDERAFGLSILIMAIPCLVPGLYGPPQIAAPIIALLAAQMLVGRREPYLPGFLRERRIPKAWLQAMAGFADKRLRWIDKIARPRLTWAATGLAERIAALAMIIAAICIFPPITNTIPSLGLAMKPGRICGARWISCGTGPLRSCVAKIPTFCPPPWRSAWQMRCPVPIWSRCRVAAMRPRLRRMWQWRQLTGC
jgi:Uncharacterized ABC-type transport system, permease components